MSTKFDSYMRPAFSFKVACLTPAEKEKMARETDKGKFASDKASPDSVSQGIKRKLEDRLKK